MKIIDGLLILIGLTVLIILAFLIHPYLGMLTSGSICILLGINMSDNHKK